MERDPYNSLCSFPAPCVHRDHGWKFCPFDALLSLYDSLQSLPFWSRDVAILNSDPCSEDALYQSSEVLGERAMVQAGFPEQANEIEPLLGFFHCGYGAKSPA